MGTAASALALGGGIAGAAGSIQQGYASSAAAGYNAKVAEENAQLAKQNAAWTGAEGSQASELQGLRTKANVGAIQTAQAANGVDITSGSAKAVQRSEAQMGALSQANIRSNAARQAYGFETQSAFDMGQASLDKSQARNDVTAGFVGGATSLLKAGAEVAMYGGGGGTPDQTSDTAGPRQIDNTAEFTDPQKYASFLGQQEPDNFNLWKYNQSSSANLFGP